MQELEFDVKMTTGVLYDFKLQHIYKQPITILATAMGCFSLYLSFIREEYRILFILVGIALIVYEPLTALYNSFLQIKMNPAYANPLHYSVNEEGISISLDGQSQTAKWEQCTKACNTRKSIIVYTGKRNAFIFPRADAGEYTEDLIAMIAEHMPPEKMKIRF